MATTSDVDVEEFADRPPGPGQALTVITPPTGRALVDCAELWRFRDLLYFLAWRDVKVRYKQTVLGAVWAVLQPAMMMIVFTLFFSRMAGVSSGGVPYPLFAYAGLLPWTFFATAVGGAGNSVIGSERLITKIYFPRLAIPFATVAASVVDFVIAFGLLAVMMLYYGVSPAPLAWLAPVVFVVIVLAALGVGTLLSALNVSYRDFRYVIPFLLQIWMFATPTVYMQVDARPSPGPALSARADGDPPPRAETENGSPAFRAAVLGGPFPWANLAGSSLASAGLFVAGCLYFHRVEDRFADII
jgi:lipopolysaccharide transport system permease protein